MRIVWLILIVKYHRRAWLLDVSEVMMRDFEDATEVVGGGGLVWYRQLLRQCY